MDAMDINIALLDRIFEHKRVLEILIDCQYQNIYNNQPKDFLTPNLRMLDIRDAREIQLVKKAKAEIFKNNQVRFVQYPALMAELKLLEIVSVAFNHLSAGNSIKVLESFEKVNTLTKTDVLLREKSYIVDMDCRGGTCNKSLVDTYSRRTWQRICTSALVEKECAL